MTVDEMLAQMDLEKQLAAEIRSKNPSFIPEGDVVYWLAEQISLRRAEALSILTGGVVYDPNASALRIAFAGSSTYEKYATDGTAATVDTATKSGDGANFSAMGTTGKGLLSYASIIAARTGKPAKYLLVGRGGSSLAGDWLPQGSGNRAALVNGIKKMRGCDVVNWACDFNDLFQNIVVDGPTQLANIRAFIALVRQETGIPALKFTVGVCQRYDGGASVAPDPKWTAVRAAEMTAALDPNVVFGAHWFDFPQVDDRIHMTDASYPAHAARVAENSLAAMGLGGAAVETGPRITAAQALYATRTRLTLAHSTGTDFAPATGLTGFRVSFDNGASWTNAVGAREDATHVLIDHASSGGAAPLIEVFPGRAPIVGGVLHDNSPRGLPLNPSVSAIQAPSGSTAVAPVAAGTRTMKVAYSKTLAAPAGYNAFHDSGSQAQNSNAGLTIPLFDVDGVATGWTLTSITAFQSGNDFQGVSTSNPATIGYIYNGAPANGDNGGVGVSPTTLVLTAPAADRGKTVELDLFGARSAGDRKVTYSAGGQSKTIDAGQNTNQSATFTGLALDAQGQLAFSFAPADGYTYGYLTIQTIRVIG